MLAKWKKKCHKFVDKSAHFVPRRKSVIIGAVAVVGAQR